MKKIIIIIVVLGIVSIGGAVLTKTTTGARNGRAPVILGSLTGKQLHKATMSIDGMWCASCATGAEYNLKALDGVLDAYVGFTKNLGGEGWVIYDKDKVTDEQIIKAIEPYKATITANMIYTE